MQRAVNRQCEAMDRYRLWLWHLNADRRNEPSFFGIETTGNTQGDSVSSIMPFAIRASISALSLSFIAGESLYDDVAIGLCQPVYKVFDILY